MNTTSFSVIGLEAFPLIKTGDNLAKIIVDTAAKNHVEIQEKDIIVVAQKIVSKTEGRLKRLSEIEATQKAAEMAKTAKKDPRLVELILRETDTVLKVSSEAMIVKDKRGLVCINAGIDRSNVSPDNDDEAYTLLPLDPDKSANCIREEIFKLTNKHVGIIICDTFSRPFRRGQANFAIGIAGIKPFFDYRGSKDLFGYVLKVKNVAIADELACTAELVMGQGNEGIPTVIVRGLKRAVFDGDTTAHELEISRDEDLFSETL